jgi:hypothetical protein
MLWEQNMCPVLKSLDVKLYNKWTSGKVTSRDSCVSIVTRLRAIWFRFPERAAMVLHSVHIGSWTHSVPYPMGTGRFSPGIKRPWYKANHSLPSSAEIKNAWRYTSTQYVFMV